MGTDIEAEHAAKEGCSAISDGRGFHIFPLGGLDDFIGGVSSLSNAAIAQRIISKRLESVTCAS
jgi:hypothetical protein